MPRPSVAMVIRWRDLAQEGLSYAEIARRFPGYTEHQVRHYCIGNSGKKIPGPLQSPGRWGGSNVWLQGEKSPHARLTEELAMAILDDWDEERGDWGKPSSEWARELGLSPRTVQMLRAGDTWKFLNHPNQGRKRRKRRSSGDAPEKGRRRRKS